MVNFKLARGPNSLAGVAATPAEQDGTYVNKKATRAAAGATPCVVIAAEDLMRDASPPSSSSSSSSAPPPPPAGFALLHPSNPLLARHGVDARDGRGRVVLLTLQGGSDCVVRAVGCDRVPPGRCALELETRYNLHVAEDQEATFAPHVVEDEEKHALADAEIELRLLRGGGGRRGRGGNGGGGGGGGDEEEEEEEENDDEEDTDDDDDDDALVDVDGDAVAAHLSARLRDRWVCAGEIIMIDGGGGGGDDDAFPPMRARVVSVNTLPATAAATTLGYHCFRGVARERTTFIVHAEGDGERDDVVTRGGGLVVANSKTRARDSVAAEAALAREVVRVTTSDGETFPVHRRLLRPCIALTRAIRDAGADGPAVSSGKLARWEREERGGERDGGGGADASTDPSGSPREDPNPNPTPTPTPSSSSNPSEPPSATVDVDCGAFDKTLAWLEARELGAALPEHDIRVTEDLLAASITLGLRELQDACERRLGAHEARVRVHAWEDVKRHNANGGVWIVIDGMVLDVKRWLPEHPGGDRIIPAQSLDAEAARHFELYHSSRESFLYLKHFYVGEVRSEDRPKVPLVRGEARASDEFLAQLREYTDDFRIDASGGGGEEEEEARVAVHLGVRSRKEA